MDATLIIYALVAAGLVFWLRSVLGTRHGDERERPNPFTTPVEGNPSDPLTDLSGDKVVTLPLADAGRPSLPRNVTLSGADAERVLMEISRVDRDFDLARFATGAQDAFVMIVEAFAAGDEETLKEFLEPQVFAAFQNAIKDRAARGESMSTEIHAVRKMDIMNVSFDGRNAHVTVRFIADETCVIKNREGVILSGDPDRITEMNDIWTFSRNVKNRDPMWYLQETRDGDVQEDHKTPVPDAG
ncbi:MAG: Tim44 domain-containing protein [Micavibrio aeruginosavorus]|uniref:Tim44 domain-containing protein n=1 Tax=Micavibrio aeruginosavorus TaxID=349221 RepID=A0A2W5N6G8_9BACT|nr:MAG: Tim44 domain-containing protein [Micavibrio aeruginosavorus]